MPKDLNIKNCLRKNKNYYFFKLECVFAQGSTTLIYFFLLWVVEICLCFHILPKKTIKKFDALVPIYP